MIVHRASKEPYPIEFHPLTEQDVRKMVRGYSKESWNPNFDWSVYFKYANTETYKMVIVGNDIIQACIALEIKEDHVYIHLIESAPHNFIGKEFDCIGEHLFSFACRRSHELGFEGAVAFRSKTGPKSMPLIRYYMGTRIRAHHLGNGYFIIDGSSAERLIMLYSR